MATKTLFKHHERALDIIDETVAFYSEDPSRRAVDEEENACYYQAQDGRRCAFGRLMKEEYFKDDALNGTTISHLVNSTNGVRTHNDLLPDKYKGFSLAFWRELQMLHDSALYWDEDGLTKEGKRKVSSMRAELKKGKLSIPPTS